MLPEPHAFIPLKAHPKQCARCGGWPDASYHNLELFTGADIERQRVHDAEEAERMSRTLKTSKDASHASAILENESPLFAGEKSTLFSSLPALSVPPSPSSPIVGQGSQGSSGTSEQYGADESR